MNRGSRGFSRSMLPLLAIQAAREYYRLERKPPVTAALLAANTLVYLKPAFLNSIIPNIHEVWFNAHLILKYKDLKRFFLSPFYHIGESHLVYNMLSLLWKGIQLETSMGSTKFASMILLLLSMSQGATLLLSKLLLFFDYQKAYYSEYSVGFSGVLFAMKVVLHSQSDDYTSLHGILIPSKYAAWAELFLIQMFVPDASFLGHLGGILAGLIYLRLRNLPSSFAPLNRVISGSWRFMKGLIGFRNQSTYGHGTVSGTWKCGACTFDNSSWLTVCEICGTGRDGTDALFSGGSSNLSEEELRLRRIARYSSSSSR